MTTFLQIYVKVNGKLNGAEQFATRVTATGTHMPHGITQCYLPPGRRDIHALTPTEAGTRLSDLGGMQG